MVKREAERPSHGWAGIRSHHIIGIGNVLIGVVLVIQTCPTICHQVCARTVNGHASKQTCADLRLRAPVGEFTEPR